MAVDVAGPARCPTCGAKLAQSHLSLCAYCGAPLGIASGAPQVDRATMRRLASMREHAEYAEAERWTPPESLDVRRDQRRARAALVLSGVGLALGGGVSAGLARNPSSFVGWIGLVATLAVAAAGAGLGIAARGRVRRALARPLLKRPALVQERRSETEPGGRGRTTYFFQLVFEDGAAAEFRYPGRGTAHDPLVAGNTGVAYTRQEDLLAFRSIRV
jgi:hypothetical protein